MVVLEAHGIGVAYAASLPVFSEVSFTLTRGFYGLVGANGAGKSTLLRVLAGKLAPHEGGVRLRPSDAAIAYCEQRVDHATRDVHELASATNGLSAELRGRLDLEPEALARWTTLSPGERKRWQIGAALAREPDLLLLDEPTNHLDAEARALLIDALQRYEGLCVFVSHDRQLLEALPRGVLRIADGVVKLHPGVYSEARVAWEHERRSIEEAHARAVADVRAAERHLFASRRVAEAASRSVGARSRMKDVHDHDARSMLAKGRARAAEKRAGRTVATARAGVERARAAVPTIERDRTLGGKVFANYDHPPHAILFHLDEAVLPPAGAWEPPAGPREPPPEHVVLRDVRLTIRRGERVRLEGANGAGKSTLLRALRASQSSDKILYLPQELEPSSVGDLVRDVFDLGPEARGRVLSIVSALGSDPSRLRDLRDTLSPGEARKLALALGLGRHAWAILLDEPTNHLDLPSIERLEDVLHAYPGCIVLVTHDDDLAAAVTETTVRVGSGTIR